MVSIIKNILSRKTNYIKKITEKNSINLENNGCFTFLFKKKGQKIFISIKFYCTYIMINFNELRHVNCKEISFLNINIHP